ncbi:FMN-binding glutamate synthase family protein, partial [Elusimicrobiota bacterium]
TIGSQIKAGDEPVFVERFGSTIEEVFVEAAHLKEEFGKDFAKLPVGAIGVYSYLSRCAQGMRQIMCGARKFGLDHITRTDIFALTREAAEMSGIAHATDLDKLEAEQIINS